MKTLKELLAFCLLTLTLTFAASAQVNITTWQVNNQHSGNNANETTLNPGNVGSSGNFGLLFSQQLDGTSTSTINGQSYGQPLLASGINVSGSTRNIVYVATEHDSIWAFDADNYNGGVPLWQVSLLQAGTTPVPKLDTGSGDVDIELGVTTTPVIDLGSSTIYVVSKVKRTSDSSYHQYLYALDLASGTTKFGSPVEINPTFSGTSNPDSSNNIIPFDALHEHMRAAMTLNNGVLYLTYASHSDTTPYHGEVIGYDPTTLQVVKTFITTPNSGDPKGGIWQSGAGPAFDVSGSNMFISVANGAWDQTSPQYGTNWGESMLKISTSGTGALGTSLFSNTLNWFTPNNWANLNDGDLDLGSGGLCILPDQAGPHTHIMVGGGKGSVLYVLDRDNLSGINAPDNTIQDIAEFEGHRLFVTPSYYNGYIYYSAEGSPLLQRAVGYNPVDGSYISTTPITSNNLYNNHGYGCFISSSGTTNGIVWILTGDGVDAYDARNVSGNPIYSANATLPGNIGCQTTKFNVPMVANGKLYFAAYENNTFTGHLLVYGLLSSGSGTPNAPSNAIATANSSSTITVNWTDNSNNESGFKIKRSTSQNGPFTAVGSGAGADVTAFTDTGLTPFTTYYYQVVAYNGNGDSSATNVTTATTFPPYTENGLVAYWSMDETQGTAVNDVTGNGHIGTINGEANFVPNGFLNDGVWFHGTGQTICNITVANKSDMQFTAAQSFTLSVWANPDKLHTTEDAVISKSADQGNFYGIGINVGHQWIFHGPGGDVAGAAATAGVWQHVAVVQDGVAGTRSIYVNGVLSGTGPAQAADGAGDFWIAQQNVTGNVSAFAGVLDEARLYNRAIPASEIPNLMGPPVLEAVSSQTHGSAGTFGMVVSPSLIKEIESRKGSTVGTYNLVLNFPVSVSGITATLGLQGGGSPVGSVNSVSYDQTGRVVTVVLTGVGNAQSLNLHLSGIVPGVGSADVPFNVLWGDVNGDNVVNALDLSIEQRNHTAIVASNNAFYDINCDGAVDASDDSLVSAAMGTSLGAQIDTNLALYRPAAASTYNGNNTPNLAFDQDNTTRWESVNGTTADPSFIYVDLGSVCTVHSIVLNWENAAGQDYTLDVCAGDPTVAGNWSHFVPPITGNTKVGLLPPYTGNASARYVRMNGTARTTQYGYSLYDFQVIGLSGTGISAAPSITGGLTLSGSVQDAMSYQITASNSPTSYNATGLPNGLSINTATGLISGMPTGAGTATVLINAINGNGTGSANLQVSVGGGGTIPVITSGNTASGTVGSAVSYQIAATNTPTSFNANNLPAGLSVNTASGLVSGTATASGNTSATVSAINTSGTGSATVVFSISGTGGGTPPVITSGNTASGTAGSAVSYQIAATNNPTSFGASNLPAGLSVNTASGLISGTATTSGTTNATVSAVNTSGTGSATVAFSISGTGGGGGGTAPVISSGANAYGTAGAAFSYQIAATNTPASFNASGLPSGLSVNTATGVISGTVAATGTTTATISAVNTSGTGTLPLVISITSTDINLALSGSATASSVNNGNVAANAIDNNFGTRWESVQGVTADPSYIYVDLGQVDTIHSVTIDWENAAGQNYTVDVCSGDPTVASNWSNFVPPVTGNNTGGNHQYNGYATARYVRMNGTTRDTQYGYSIYEFQVWGVVGVSGGSAPVVTSGTAVSGTAGNGVNYQITASNTPTSFAAANLPAGLSVNTASGLISGTAATSGTTSATVSAINTSGTGSATVVFSISNPPPGIPVITSGTTTSGTVGAAYSYQITASNSPASFSAANLPAGLSVNTASGLISGTATTSGATNATISAINTSGTGSAPLAFTISGTGGGGTTPVITSGSNVFGTAGAAFSYQIAATNTPASFNASGLPAGLSVNTATGVISGTVATAGTTTANISAVNTSGTGTLPMVISITSTDTNLALSGSATASSVNNGNVAANAIDNNFGTRWESIQGLAADPSYFYVDLGQVDTIHSVTIDWENAAGQNYTVDVCSGDPTVASNWSNFVPPVTGNNTGGNHQYNGNVTTARYVRMNGTTRDTQYGYSIYEFQVWGVVGAGGGSAPVVTSGTAVSGTTGSAVSYQIAASNSPTSFSASNLPAGLSVNTASGLVSGTATASGTTSATVSAINTSGTGSATVVFSISNPPPGPVITSGSTMSGTVASALSYQITASNSPTSFSAANLPAGLSVNTASGLISGTATTSGTTNATISAINTSGTGSAPLVFTISGTSGGGTTPVISSGSNVFGTAGAAFSYQIAATNTPTGFNASGLPAGLSVNTATGVISGTVAATGTTSATISAVNTSGTGTLPMVISITSTDTNLALSGSATASSVNNGNVAANAIDNNLGSRWESVQGAAADPSYIYVDLGQVHTIHSVVINWENAAGQNYTVDICNGDPTVESNWSNFVPPVIGNNTGGIHPYNGNVTTARYVRMHGTTRDTQYGYSIYEFQIWGQ